MIEQIKFLGYLRLVRWCVEEKTSYVVLNALLEQKIKELVKTIDMFEKENSPCDI